MNNESKLINDYFDTLEDWKKLPAYRLEVRIDSFVGFVLPKVFESIYNYKTRIVIPEFPIRLGTVRKEVKDKYYANRSYKVDFYIRTTDNKNIFIEFKTDSGSRREGQDKYLKSSTKVKMKAILEGIIQISKATSPIYRKNYNHLLSKLLDCELLKVVNKEYQITISDEDIEVYYVQPKVLKYDTDKNVVDFETLSKEIEKCYPNSKLMNRLSESILKWGAD